MSVINSIVNWLTPYKAVRWGVDISKWNTFTKADLVEFKKHGCSFVWIQMSNGLYEDPKFEANRDLVNDVGIPYGPYSWLIPNQDALAQANFTVNLFKTKATGARNFMLDLEQKTVTEIYDEKTALIPASTILGSAVTYTKRVTSLLSVPFIIYSSPGFLSYIPGYRDYVSYYWYANASYASNDKLIMTWAQFQTYLSHVPKPTIPSWIKQSDVDFHQCTSNACIVMESGHVHEPVDIDTMQDEADYQTLFGTPQEASTPVIETPVTPPNTPAVIHKVTAEVGLYVRTRPDPSSMAVGTLKNGDVVVINSTATNGWVNLTHGSLTGWSNGAFIS